VAEEADMEEASEKMMVVLEVEDSEVEDSEVEAVEEADMEEDWVVAEEVDMEVAANTEESIN